MKNALTIDVEDWYHTADLNLDTNCWPEYESRIEYGVNNILEILSTKNVKATFFILGYIAKEKSSIVRKISELGHEIGSHGYWHRMIGVQSRKEFKNEVKASKVLLEDITGKKVKLFRAPNWSIDANSLWALDIIEELGFICDSSIQPFVTPLSGMKGVPTFPFYPVINGRKLNIVEVPSTVIKVGRLHIPFAGGLYLRVFPYSFISYALKKVNQKRPGMVYIHPWETDLEQPRICKTPICRFTHYYNLRTTLYKLKNLINNFNFITLGELIEEAKFPSIEIY